MLYMRFKSLFTFVTLVIFLLFVSCATQLNGTVQSSGRASVSFDSELLPRTITLINSVRSFSGGNSGEHILDGNTIRGSIAFTPGVEEIRLVNRNTSTLEGDLIISNIGDFLAVGEEDSRFVSYTPRGTGGSISINLNMSNAPLVISMLSPEIEEYLMALMAPVVVRETYTRDEYLSLLAMVYGQALANEIAAARINAVLIMPSNVLSVRGGDFSGNQVSFSIPLVDIMVLENPLYYEVHW